MSRVRIAALALVNWKGVFYERYLLDRHVTALEGANGAGKTTVMIAAYVVLLPDMTKLRFTNLGETAAIGGDRGIWGRLGEPGRPSYAVLDLELADGERLIAGVRLIRASEPTVEPTAFVISGLAHEVRLSDILLARRLDGDHVPELDELTAAVTRAGGALEVFRTIKDYFAVLFDRGVTPMRLAGDDERSKLNEMLRTSMTGGISRALTSELRGFLLKQEAGLGEALSRMRANLEACRRTRAEVAESRQLEREITAIYEAGAEMFAAAVHAARLAAGEAEQRVAAAQPALDRALAAQRDREAEIAALEQRERELEARRAAARADLARVTAERDRRTAVLAVTFRIAELDRELETLAQSVRAARGRQAAAAAERQAARQGRDAAREAYDRAALGLAHLQQGLDELVRRAHGHRQLERRLADARRLLDRPALTPETAAAALAELDAERARCDDERARLDRELRDLEARRAEHAAACAALEAIDPTGEDPRSAGEAVGLPTPRGRLSPIDAGMGALPAAARHDRARSVLARLAAREGLLGRGHELEREQCDAERLATRQQASHVLAGELGLDAQLGNAPATAIVARELDAAEREVAAAEDAARQDAAADAAPRIAELRARLAAHDDRLAAWHRSSTAAQRLAERGPAPASRAEVIALRDRLLADHHALAAKRAALEASREQTRQRAIALERAGTAVDPELIRLRDEFGGELLAERFEDLDPISASVIEARLGPLVDALIVDDPGAAAATLCDAPRTLSTVWLVAAGTALEVGPEAADPSAGSSDSAAARAHVGAAGRKVTGQAELAGTAAKASDPDALALNAMIPSAHPVGTRLSVIATSGAHVGAAGRKVSAQAELAGMVAEAGDPHVPAPDVVNPAGEPGGADSSDSAAARAHVGAAGRKASAQAELAGMVAEAGDPHVSGPDAVNPVVNPVTPGSGAIAASRAHVGAAGRKVSAQAELAGIAAEAGDPHAPAPDAVNPAEDTQSTSAIVASRARASAAKVAARRTSVDHTAGGAVDAGAARDEVCVERHGVRITRRPEAPTLGRRAREQHTAALHAQVARDDAALDALAAEAARLAGWRRDADELVAHVEAWLGGDPAGERADLASELARVELAVHAQRERARTAQTRTAEVRRRRDGLRRLLGDAALLDPPEHAVRAREVAALRAGLATARADLDRAAPHRRLLAEHLDVLRRPPPDDDRQAAHVQRTAELAGELDRLFLARGALDDVLAHRHAGAWGDAEHAFAAQSGLAPALERQHADARAAVQAAEQAEADAATAWEAATAAALEVEAQHAAAIAHRERAAAELVALGGPVAGDDHDQQVTAAIDHVNAIEAELRSLVTAAALAAERRDQAARAAGDARTRLADETRAAGPAAAAWTELRETAAAAGLLPAALASAHHGRTSIQLTADAWSKREVLLDRVTRARGGGELGDAIRALALDGPSYLRAWQRTREWLRHRVPAQVVEVDDPLAALERLRSHLDVLEGRLARQEHDLRGTSEDVARGIDVQLRRAAGQIRRLNHYLDGIQFGSVRGIRIELHRIDRMEQILRALRLGEAQELLFLSAIPIEEALDEIFRRYGGGRAGGERLLDYREYLELAVQIRRQIATDWETASPTRLSTGEAIGVGAAIMMVVLTEWERDANLLRAQRTSGSLRFLFLDEANRLSRDNLGVLFDLCRTLDLQLLIAAPEVARAEGNTTYRLVRHVTDDGREEVIVSGRRAAGATQPE